MNRTMRSFTRGGLLLVEFFVAVTAIGGGIALMAGLEANRFPLELLRGTPFSSYMLPGLLLAVIVGGSAAVAAVATLRKSPSAGALSLMAGLAMLGWIAGEILLLDQPSEPTGIEVLYLVLGAVMAALGLWMRQGRNP